MTITTSANPLLVEFIRAEDIRSKWDAARRLMAAKQMQAVSNQPNFYQAFRDLGEASLRADGVDRLLGIDLLIRISELVKKTSRLTRLIFFLRCFARNLTAFGRLRKVGPCPPRQSQPRFVKTLPLPSAKRAAGGS